MPKSSFPRCLAPCCRGCCRAHIYRLAPSTDMYALPSCSTAPVAPSFPALVWQQKRRVCRFLRFVPFPANGSIQARRAPPGLPIRCVDPEPAAVGNGCLRGGGHDRDLRLTEPLLGGLVVRLLRGFVVPSRQAVVLPEANSLILRALQQLAAPAPCPNLSPPSLLVDPPPQLLSRGGLEREGHLRRGDAGAP